MGLSLRMGLLLLAGLVLAALTVVSCVRGMAASIGEKYCGDISRAEARIEAAERGEDQAHARGKQQDGCSIHGANAAVHSGGGA